MRALAILVLAALAAAGCVSPSADGPHQLTVCLERGIQATWKEPGLGDAFAEAARRAGWNVSTEAPSGGIPSTVPGISTLALVWFPETPRARPRVMIFNDEEAGTVGFSISGERDRAEGERVFRAFLGHIGLADATDADAWVEGLFSDVDAEGNRMDPTFRHVRVIARPDLSVVLATMRDAPLVPQGLGTATMKADGWEAHVRLPVDVVTVPMESGRMTISSDFLGAFGVFITVPSYIEGWRHMEERTGRAFADLGLPAPTFHGMSGGGAGC